MVLDILLKVIIICWPCLLVVTTYMVRWWPFWALFLGWFYMVATEMLHIKCSISNLAPTLSCKALFIACHSSMHIRCYIFVVLMGLCKKWWSMILIHIERIIYYLSMGIQYFTFIILIILDLTCMWFSIMNI